MTEQGPSGPVNGQATRLDRITAALEMSEKLRINLNRMNLDEAVVMRAVMTTRWSQTPRIAGMNGNEATG